MPSDVVGTGPPLPLIVVPVVPVAAVGESLVVPAGDTVSPGEAVPVGEASGGGPSDWSAWPPPHDTNTTNAAAHAIMSFRRTALLSRLTVG
ncbi:MAG: hypothetical protein ACRDH7_11655 [Actinomycetota bacterium]